MIIKKRLHLPSVTPGSMRATRAPIGFACLDASPLREYIYPYKTLDKGIPTPPANLLVWSMLMKKAYRDFCRAVSRLMPKERMITDPLELAAVGADASFYSLIPQVIVEVNHENQVCLILREARKRRLPVTFRAAGTSLSGQAVSDSILIRLGRGWEALRIFDKARRIRLGPGLVGGMPTAAWPLWTKKSDRIRPPSTQPRWGGFWPTMPRACAAAPHKTPIRPWTASVLFWPTAPSWIQATI